MTWLEWLKPQSYLLREKIISSQKEEIDRVQEELSTLRNHVKQKEEEMSVIHEKHDETKERLVSQIVDLSNKFADNHQRVIDIAQENARLKVILETQKLTKQISAGELTDQSVSQQGKKKKSKRD